MDWARWLVALLFGVWMLTLGALLWRLLIEAQPWRRQSDRRMPWLFRCMWWPTALCAHYLDRHLRAAWRVRIMERLRLADLDAELDPACWCGLQLWLTALVMFLALLWQLGRGSSVAWLLFCASPAPSLALELWLQEHIRQRQRSILREWPAYLDMLTLGLEAGCGFGVALRMAVERGAPTPLRGLWQRALDELRTGLARSEVLLRLQRRSGLLAVTGTISAINQAEASGASLSGILRAQATQCTQERFARAEKLAMEAPVKMLGPLITCIFPCTFIVVGFPIAAKIVWGV
ncbi:MAG: type II secretion system F family protein [Steroidobacteraceae bacterium]